MIPWNHLISPIGNITLDVAPMLVGDRTLVPINAIVGAFFATVEWDEITKTVIIAK